MKVLIISATMALDSGSPRQRAGAQLKHDVAHYANVKWLTIDVGAQQWAARSRMDRADHLFGALRGFPNQAQKRPFMQIPYLDAELPLSAPEVEAPPSDQILFYGWLNDRRIERIVRQVEAYAPDVVLIDSEVFGQLSSDLRGIAGRIIVFDWGLSQWMTALSERLGNPDQSRWHANFARGLESQLRKAKKSNAEVLSLGWSQVASDVAKSFCGRMSIEPNELFFLKTTNLIVPATGFAWLDRLVLAQVTAYCQQMTDRGFEAPNTILIGFPPSLTKKLAAGDIVAHWDKLHNYVGAARAVYMPYLTPQLVALVEASLGVGTPVIIDQRDALHYQFAGFEGIFAGDESSFNLAIAHALNEELLSEEDHRAIAASAAERQQGYNVKAIIGEIKAQPQPSKTVTRHIGARAASTTVVFNSITGMLLVRLHLRKSARIDEVRLLNDKGLELTRLAPNQNSPHPTEIFIEGGLVVTQSELGAGVGIELHDPSGKIEEEFIKTEDILSIECEVALAHFDATRLRGAFWTLASIETPMWAIKCNQKDPSIVGRKNAIKLEGLGPGNLDIVAVPFTIPLPQRNLQASDSYELTRIDAKGFDIPNSLYQRPFKPSKRLLASPTAPAIELLALKNKHAGKRGWIIGNGPSVRLEDLAAVPEDDIKFCFNRFYLSYGDMPLREDYVVSADTLMIKDFGQEMIDISTGLPLFCLNFSELSELNGRFIHLTPSDTHLPIFSTNPEHFVSVGGSSVYIAIQMAYYMGIRELVLYGIDYSFTMTLTRDPRFPFPVAFDEGNHFIKSYRGAKPWCPPTWRDISAGFLNARIAYELDNGRILNATRGGKLETFVRADFDELVKGK